MGQFWASKNLKGLVTVKAENCEKVLVFGLGTAWLMVPFKRSCLKAKLCENELVLNAGTTLYHYKKISTAVPVLLKKKRGNCYQESCTAWHYHQVT